MKHVQANLSKCRSNPLRMLLAITFAATFIMTVGTLSTYAASFARRSNATLSKSTSTHSAAATAYNRSAAVAYALKWGDTASNDDGQYYGNQGGDCTHFVSRALNAGGINDGNISNPNNLADFLTAKQNPLAQLIVEPSRGSRPTPPSNLQQGDVILYSWHGNSSYWNHAAIVTVAAGNNSRVAEHSFGLSSGQQNEKDQPWDDWWGYKSTNITYGFLLINGSSSGTTQSPVDNSQLVSSSPSVTAQPGQPFTIQFSYRNTGTTTWSDGSGYALSCDIHYHASSNCMSGSPVGFGGTSVPPGQQFTFTVWLIAPSSPGSYTTWWDMTDNGGIFGNNNSSVTVTIPAASSSPTQTPTSTPTTPSSHPIDNSQLVSNSPLLVVQPGQQITIQFIYKNDGTTTWSDGGGYAIGCDTYYHSNSICMGGGSIGFGGASVVPGQQYTFTISLTAPSASGTYRTWWDMTHNGSIFGNNNSFVTVIVQASTPPPTPVDNSQWISNSPLMTVLPNQQITIQFTYKNDGTTTWSDGGSYALGCDTYYHSNSNCMGAQSVNFGGAIVAPGQQFTFTLTLTAPGTSGTYQTWWDMTHNGSIFGNNNSFVTIIVQPLVDNSQWISNSLTMTVLPGQQFTVQFTYRNDGTTAWSDGGSYSLRCDTYYHSNSNCMSVGPVGFNGQSVTPGQQFSFVFNLTAPSTSGTYTTWWDMTHNGSIFGNNNSYITVVVQTMVDNSQWVSNSSPVTVQPGQQFTVQFTYRNDGTTTWSDGGSYSLRCDTYYHSNSDCMGGGPVGFGGQSVAPGQQFTFWVTLVAPSAPGTYTTWWDMTHNGSIFGNNNSYVTVTVV